MPIIESAKKRVKTIKKKTAKNKKWTDKLKAAIREMENKVEAGDKEAAAEQLKETKKVIDKAASKNLIHKNNAARKKSRLTKMYNNM